MPKTPPHLVYEGLNAAQKQLPHKEFAPHHLAKKTLPKSTTPPRVWQRMLSGRRLDLLNPSPFDIEIEDIAHGLARVARWNGQTQGAHIFSVAQHSVMVEEIAQCLHGTLTKEARLMILLHDAPEYVIGDVISPFKAVVGEIYQEVEARLMHAVHLRFGLPAQASAPVKKIMKQADRLAAFCEAIQLAGFERAEALQFFGPYIALPEHLEHTLTPWTAEEAKHAFLDKFMQISAVS
jgi:uncharacterized protein